MNIKFSILGAVLAAAASQAMATENVYLLFPGVTGTTTEKGLVGTIPLKSYSQAFTTTGSTQTQIGKVLCGAINFTKQTDNSSTNFLTTLFRGVHVPTMTVYFTDTTAAAGGYTTPVKIVLTGVFVTGLAQAVDTSVGNTNTLVESVSMLAQTFSVSYTPTTVTGAPGNPATFNWNCVTNTTF